jgi:hypothetical protein
MPAFLLLSFRRLIELTKSPITRSVTTKKAQLALNSFRGDPVANGHELFRKNGRASSARTFMEW